jgi:hypothetical protein
MPALVAASDPSASDAATHWTRAIQYFGPSAAQRFVLTSSSTSSQSQDLSVDVDPLDAHGDASSSSKAASQLVSQSLHPVVAAARQPMRVADLPAAAQGARRGASRPTSIGVPFSRTMLVAGAFSSPPAV